MNSKEYNITKENIKEEQKMRKPLKFAIVTTLVSTQLMTLGCAKQDDIPVSAPVISEPIEQTQEFAPTTDNWADSNYKKYWLKIQEVMIEEEIASKYPEYTCVSELNGIKIYQKESDAEIFYQLVGKGMVKLINNQPMYTNKGDNIWYVTSEEEKENLLNQDYSVDNWIDGYKYTDSLIKEFNNVQFVNMTLVLNRIGQVATKGEQTVTIPNHVLEQCQFNPNIEMSVDKIEQVIDSKTLNMYYAVYFDSETNTMYATPEVIKHIIGWDISVNEDNVCIWTDEIFKPIEESVVVRGITDEERLDPNSPYYTPGYDKLLELQNKEFMAKPESETTANSSADTYNMSFADKCVSNWEKNYGIVFPKEIEDAWRNSPLSEEDFFDKYCYNNKKHYEGPLSDTTMDWIPTECQELSITIYSKLGGMSRDEYLESIKKYHPSYSKELHVISRDVLSE